jgi:hypothetical protein
MMRDESRDDRVGRLREDSAKRRHVEADGHVDLSSVVNQVSGVERRPSHAQANAASICSFVVIEPVPIAATTLA